MLDYLTVRTTETAESVKTTLETYNKKKVDVKITNRALEADRWYPMVLPFATKVSEISKAFEDNYAVVNVPDENRTDGVVAFKLHVGEIKANTLFLVKLEDPWKAPEGEGTEIPAIKFTQRIIEYAGDDCVVYSGANKENEFHGVYVATKAEDPTWWYLKTNSATDNTFYNCGTNPTNISPLSGDIVTPEAAAARIIVEEADGTITAINAITGEAINNNAEGWYTVGGMKLEGQPTQKGVYINNGKKVVIK